MKRIFLTLLPLACSLIPLASHGESETVGAYTVHYQAVNSTFLQSEIAERYGIVRGDRRGFLNVSVLHNQPEGSPRAVSASVSGRKRNLLGQDETIDFREIREGGAIYYIGEFRYSNAENVRFSINVSPGESGETFDIRWDTRMYDN